MPHPQKDTRRERGFPVGMRRYNVVHQRKKSVGVVLHFDVDVELYVRILGLCRKCSGFSRMRNPRSEGRDGPS